MAMTNGIFREPSPGVIAHTAQSRVLAEDENMQAWIGFNGEDIFPAAGHVLQALKAHPEATSLTRAGFQFAFDTVDKEPMFATFGKDPNRARRMGRAMASLTGGEGYEPSYFVDAAQGGYDFSALDAAGGTFVDIGGSHGFICVDLATRYRNMKFVVQDLQKTVDSAPTPISADPQVAGRITLLAHDFFTEQVTKDADGNHPPSLFLLLTPKTNPPKSILLPLDPPQLLHPLRRPPPAEPHPGPQARRPHPHQRPLPAGAGLRGESLGRAGHAPHGHRHADAAQRAGADRG